MNRRTLSAATLLALGLGIGIFSSFLALTILQNTQTEHQPAGLHDDDLGLTEESLNNVGPSVESRSSSNPPIPRSISALTLSDSSYERRAEMSSWILALNEQTLVDWLEQSVNTDWDVSPNARKDVQDILITKLTSYNPSQALDFALARFNPVRTEFIKTVFFEWTIANLDAAIEQAISLEEKLKRFALQGILEAVDSHTLEEHKEIARKLGDETYATTYQLQKFLHSELDDPKELWFQAIALEDLKHEHYQLLTQLAVSWIETAGMGVLKEITESMADVAMRDAVTRDVLIEIAKSAPDTAFEFALRLTSENRQFVVRNVIEIWADQDPRVALAAVEVVPPGQFRSDLEFSAVLQWVQNDPKDVLLQLPELPVSTRESAVTEAIYLIAEDAPTEAASLVAEVDENMQWQARDILLESWITQDFNAAIDWVENSESIKASDRPYVLHDLANKLYWVDPNRAFQMARQVSLLGESTVGTEAMIIGRIANSDLSLAMELLPQVREGDTKTSAYVSIATTLIEQGDTQEALNLSSQLPASDQSDFFIDLSRNWAHRDLAGLLAKMDSFPTSEIRSKIALKLTQTHRSYPTYTDSQIELLETYLSADDKNLLESSTQ